MKNFIICRFCGNKREVPLCKANRKFCNRNHYTKYKEGKPGYWLGKKRPEVKNWLIPPKISYKKGKKMTKEEISKMNLSGLELGRKLREEESPNWKGNQVKYPALHQWINRHKGKANHCIYGHKARKYVWANISGDYKRDLSDYHSLCTSCNMTDGIKIAERFNYA